MGPLVCLLWDLLFACCGTSCLPVVGPLVCLLWDLLFACCGTSCLSVVGPLVCLLWDLLFVVGPLVCLLWDLLFVSSCPSKFTLFVFKFEYSSMNLPISLSTSCLLLHPLPVSPPHRSGSGSHHQTRELVLVHTTQAKCWLPWEMMFIIWKSLRGRSRK